MSTTRAGSSPSGCDQRERLAQRLPVHHQRQVDRELHARRVAEPPDVLHAAAQLPEQLLRALQVLRVAAGEPEQLALRGRAGGAADRALHVGGALAAFTRGPISCCLAGGTVLISMNSLPLRALRQQAVGAEVDVVQRLRVGEDGDDRFRAAVDGRRRGGPLRAVLQQRLGALLRCGSRP